jgi:hypothetical protein
LWSAFWVAPPKQDGKIRENKGNFLLLTCLFKLFLSFFLFFFFKKKAELRLKIFAYLPFFFFFFLGLSAQLMKPSSKVQAPFFFFDFSLTL